MRTAEEVHTMVLAAMGSMLGTTLSFSSEYSRGVCNGLEMVLAYMEERPVFYRDEYKKHLNEDIAKFPEYFL